MAVTGTRRLTGVAILAAVLVLAAVVLPGCGGVAAPTNRANTPERSVVSEQLRPLAKALRAAFVSGGGRGFFVEGEPRTSGAMDLYQTAWWAAAAPSKWRSRLARRTVGTWARQSLYLLPGASGVQYGSLDQISLALQLVTLLHVGYSKGRVQSELERLYSQANSTGAKVTALSVIARLWGEMNARLPGRFEREILRDADAILSGQGEWSTGTVIAVLSALPRGWAVQHRGPLRTRLRRIMQATSTTGGQGLALSVRRGLTGALKAVGMRWRISCSKPFLRSLQKAEADPHMVDLAEANGCGHFPPPPMSSLGWPTQWSVSQSLASSVDGYRLAMAIGTANDYRKQLATEVKQVWLPGYMNGSEAEHGPATLGDLYLLRSLLRVRIDLPRPALPKHWTLSTDLVLLPAALLAGYRGALPSKLALIGHSGVTYGVVLHLIFLYTRAQSAQRDAEASLRALHWDNGVVVGSNALWWTLLADWVRHASVSPGELRRAGLCDASLNCVSQRAGQRNPQPWLQVAGAVAALEEAAAYSIPSPYL